MLVLLVVGVGVVALIVVVAVLDCRWLLLLHNTRPFSARAAAVLR